MLSETQKRLVDEIELHEHTIRKSDAKAPFYTKFAELKAIYILKLYDILLKCETKRDDLVIKLIDDISLHSGQVELFWLDELDNHKRPPGYHVENSIFSCIRRVANEIPDGNKIRFYLFKGSRLKASLNDAIVQLKNIQSAINEIEAYKQRIETDSSSVKSARKS